MGTSQLLNKLLSQWEQQHTTQRCVDFAFLGMPLLQSVILRQWSRWNVAWDKRGQNVHLSDVYWELLTVAAGWRIYNVGYSRERTVTHHEWWGCGTMIIAPTLWLPRLWGVTSDGRYATWGFPMWEWKAITKEWAGVQHTGQLSRARSALREVTALPLPSFLGCGKDWQNLKETHWRKVNFFDLAGRRHWWPF